VLASLAPNGFSQTQIELNRKQAAEFEKADAALNGIYKKALAKAAAVDEERKQKLIKAQRAWLLYRDVRRRANQPHKGTCEDPQRVSF